MEAGGKFKDVKVDPNAERTTGVAHKKENQQKTLKRFRSSSSPEKKLE